MRTSDKRPVIMVVVAILTIGISCSQSQAIELLTNGDLESSVAPPGWTLEQTVTGLPGASVNASEQISFANEPMTLPGELGMFLRPFAGNQGSYADENRMINFELSQQITAGPGRTYTFTGHSFFGGDADSETNDGYSGGVTTLDPMSPSGEVASPTDTTFELAFLDSSDNVIGAPLILDLRAEQMNDAMWREHTLMGEAPAGTATVQVTAAARNMVANFGFQNSYLDNFTLIDSLLPGVDRLTNGNLNMVGPPSGFELVESPESIDTASFRDFANHTEGGQQGLWLRAFAGNEETGLVDAILSQIVEGVPGGDYTYSVWSRWEEGYGGALPGSPTQTLMQMEFLDESDGVIGSPLTLDLLAAGQMADGDWRQYFLNGTAPEGTASIKVSAAGLEMFNSQMDPQSAFFDDFSLDLAVDGEPGDYNEDGVVNAADYPVWRDALGQSVMLPNEDPNTTPGMVTQEDYDFWKSQYGNVAGVSAGSLAAVPEPATLILLLFATLGSYGIISRP